MWNGRKLGPEERQGDEEEKGGIRLVEELSMSICFLKHLFSWSSCSFMVNLTCGSHCVWVM